MRGGRGFTLAELLVSCGILSGMMLTLIGIYNMSFTSFRLGTARMSLQDQARQCMNRITPYLASAIAPTDTADAILAPSLTPSGTVYSVDFWTPSDYLNTNFETQNVYNPDLAGYNPRASTLYLYRITFPDPGVTTPPSDVTLFKLNAVYDPTDGLKTAIAGTLYDPMPANPSAGISGPRVLARRIQLVAFDRFRQGGIRVLVRARDTNVRNAVNRERTIDYTLDTRIQFPYYSSQ